MVFLFYLVSTGVIVFVNCSVCVGVCVRVFVGV